MTDNTQKAYEQGAAFAEYLNEHPHEAQNWRPLERGDEMPEGDYIELRDQCGGVTDEMEAAYRKGFNDTFEPL